MRPNIKLKIMSLIIDCPPSSRLALPLTYPLNSASVHHLEETENSLQFKHEEVARCLSHVKPMVVGEKELIEIEGAEGDTVGYILPY
jgi:hypothetical protein